jgi:hypothetical protein
VQCDQVSWGFCSLRVFAQWHVWLFLFQGICMMILVLQVVQMPNIKVGSLWTWSMSVKNSPCLPRSLTLEIIFRLHRRSLSVPSCTTYSGCSYHLSYSRKVSWSQYVLLSTDVNVMNSTSNHCFKQNTAKFRLLVVLMMAPAFQWYWRCQRSSIHGTGMTWLDLGTSFSQDCLLLSVLGKNLDGSLKLSAISSFVFFSRTLLTGPWVADMIEHTAKTWLTVTSCA